jgi:hypothetical protein
MTDVEAIEFQERNNDQHREMVNTPQRFQETEKLKSE